MRLKKENKQNGNFTGTLFGFHLQCLDKTKYEKCRQHLLLILGITLIKTVSGVGVHCLSQYAREARRFIMGTLKKEA